MLSYMIPVETKKTATTQNLNLVLNLNNNDIIDKSSMMDRSERQQQSSDDFITSEKQSSVIECDLDEKINLVNEKLQHQKMVTTMLTTDHVHTTTTSSVIVDKSKLTKLNLKNAPLKR